MSYTTIAKVEGQLQSDITDSQEPLVTAIIESVSQFIEEYTGRSFVATTLSKKYYPSSGNLLLVDPILTITSVTLQDDDIDFTAIGNAPHQQIRITPGYNSINSKNHVEPYIVTGSFGSTTTAPKGIELAATLLVADAVKEMEHNHGGGYSAETIGPYSYKKGDRQSSNQLNAMTLLAPYRKRAIV